MQIEFRDSTSILTEASGFLEGYTHSINPAIGCPYGRGACGVPCYAQFLHAHVFRNKNRASNPLGEWGTYLVVKQNAVALLEKEFERASRRNPTHKFYIGNLKIFASPATEPLVAQTLDIYRGWLKLGAQYPIRKWVIQTRSPLILDLKNDIERLGNKCCISFTLETDSDSVFSAIAPTGSPLPSQRRKVVEQLRTWDTTVSLAVSPALPIENVETFADWISNSVGYALVDTFLAGDGSDGVRTGSRSKTPEIFEANGWDWRDETQAKTLFRLLQGKMGNRVRWSQEGFMRLVELD
jgi:DNA repair photolyase